MSKNRLKRHFAKLKVLKSAHGSKRRALLTGASTDLVRCLSDCAQNVLEANVKLTAKQKASLKRSAPYIRLLGGKRLSIRRKKSLLIQRGGELS